MVDYFKKLFNRLVKFLKIRCSVKIKNEKITGKYQTICTKIEYSVEITIESIKDNPIWNKENDKHKDKSHDNFSVSLYKF